MKKGTVRILAMLLLAVTLVTLSGIASTASALVDAETHSSCCAADTNDLPAGNDVPEKGPCSTPDCPCFSCMNLILPDSITLHHSPSVEILAGSPPQQLHLCDYVASIEYPPEAA